MFKFLSCLFCLLYLTRGVFVGALGHYKTSRRAKCEHTGGYTSMSAWLVVLLLYNNISFVFPPEKVSRMLPEYLLSRMKLV